MLINEFKKGAMRGLGILLVLGTGLFAFQVSGTIKTWTTGETLTAADLNTTVQSLKTAVENATQVGQLTGPDSGASAFIAYTPLLVGLSSNSVNISSPIPRAGMVKNVKLTRLSTTTAGVSCVYTLTKNNVDTDILITVPENTAVNTVYTDPDTVSFVAGDSMVWKTSCTHTSLGQQQTGKSFLSFEF